MPYVRKLNALTRHYHASKIQKMYRGRLRNRKRKSVKKKVKTNTRRINKLVNAQKSYVDNVYNFSINGTTGSITNIGLNTISQGNALSQRIGDKITLKSITINGFVQNALSTLAADAFNNIRVILIQLSQPNLTATPLAVTDFLEIANYLSLYKKRPNYKFKVLFDKHWMTNSQTSGGATWQPVNPFRKHFKMNVNFPKGLDVTYAPGTGTPIANNLKLVLISDSLAVPHPTLNIYSRLNYNV